MIYLLLGMRVGYPQHEGNKSTKECAHINFLNPRLQRTTKERRLVVHVVKMFFSTKYINWFHRQLIIIDTLNTSLTLRLDTFEKHTHRKREIFKLQLILKSFFHWSEGFQIVRVCIKRKNLLFILKEIIFDFVTIDVCPHSWTKKCIELKLRKLNIYAHTVVQESKNKESCRISRCSLKFHLIAKRNFNSGSITVSNVMSYNFRSLLYY